MLKELEKAWHFFAKLFVINFLFIYQEKLSSNSQLLDIA